MTELTPKQLRAAKLARQRINVFAASYPDSLQLARYAAFPLSLTPELLYFMLENSEGFGDVDLMDVPWYGVSDVLLSGLCDRVGYGLYEMSAALRVELLKDLQEDMGEEQIEELGDFMGNYIQHSLPKLGQRAKMLGDRPQWTVLACLRPNEMLEQIKADLQQRWESSEERDRFHWSAMLETYGAMLPGLPILQQWADQLLEGQRPGFIEDQEIPDPNVLKNFTFDVVVIDRQGIEISRQQKSARYFIEPLGEISAVKVPCLEMVQIPGGEFLMGSPRQEGYDREKPQHKVQISPFFMAKHQVTQAQWRAVVAMPKVSIDLEPKPSRFDDDDNLPVDSVSWSAAQEFCQRVTNFVKRHDDVNAWVCRLPTEAEWEYACRAGTTSPFHFGETITANLANYDGSRTYAEESATEYRKKTTIVGSFVIANNFGLYDMHGNVWEWCADHWHDNYYNAPTNGSVWQKSEDSAESTYVLRGGSWIFNPNLCRSAYRNRFNFGNYDGNVGFRVVYAPARTP
jgi:formylglycine-generating enzyme required for sulfatase activity